MTLLRKVERITLENGDPDAWICICHNMPGDAGFYPCDDNGNEVEPVKGGGWQGLYVCNACGRIIEMDSLIVVGRNPNPVWLS